MAMAQVSPPVPMAGEVEVGAPAARLSSQLPAVVLPIAWTYADSFVAFAVRALVATSTMRAQEETLSSVVRELAVMAEVLVLYHEFMVLAGSLAESDWPTSATLTLEIQVVVWEAKFELVLVQAEGVSTV